MNHLEYSINRSPKVLSYLKDRPRGDVAIELWTVSFYQ